MFNDNTPTGVILFLIIYGITGAVSAIAAVYLLLRRGNAFAPDVTPPIRLRRWAASFFAVAALAHVWWYLFIIYSRDVHSAFYVVVAVVDCFGMLTTIAGTLFAMLQDRKRPVWPIVAALIPYVVIGALYIAFSDNYYHSIAIAYILLLYVLFTIYVAFAVRQYGRWLRDNYADLERKEVWMSQVLLLVFMLLFILYTLVDTETVQIYVLHAVELVLFSLLLWRVETLPSLTPDSSPTREESIYSQGQEQAEELFTPLHTREEKGSGSAPFLIRREVGGEALGSNVTARIDQLLAEHCVGTQLYLQHDLTLRQLVQAIGTNRSYLSQYFSRQGITYNTYINNLRINHFISRFHEVVSTKHPFTVQQLARESGYRSYSTFSLAFKQRMGRSVTTWMRETYDDMP